MKKLFSDFNFTWALGLFGTAVGAGILFLPINAGMGGIWPLIVITIIVGPMTYYAHRGLARFVLSSKNPGQDITYVVQEHFGTTGGRLITLLYFLAIYPILLIYGVGITNTVRWCPKMYAGKRRANKKQRRHGIFEVWKLKIPFAVPVAVGRI